MPDFQYVPAHFPWVKTSWLQDLAERFSNDIDVLSLESSSILGGWSREPLFYAITPAKVLLLLLILTIGFALAGSARVVILKNYSLSGFKPTTGRFWRDGILFALRRALSGFFIFTGTFFASVPLLPHLGLALGGFPTFAIAAKVGQLGYFWTPGQFPRGSFVSSSNGSMILSTGHPYAGITAPFRWSGRLSTIT